MTQIKKSPQKHSKETHPPKTHITVVRPSLIVQSTDTGKKSELGEPIFDTKEVWTVRAINEHGNLREQHTFKKDQKDMAYSLFEELLAKYKSK